MLVVLWPAIWPKHRCSLILMGSSSQAHSIAILCPLVGDSCRSSDSTGSWIEIESPFGPLNTLVNPIMPLIIWILIALALGGFVYVDSGGKRVPSKGDVYSSNTGDLTWFISVFFISLLLSPLFALVYIRWSYWPKRIKAIQRRALEREQASATTGSSVHYRTGSE
jgi:hypothetical protein